MSLFNADFEQAKDIFAHYEGALVNLKRRLAEAENANQEEIQAIDEYFRSIAKESNLLHPGNIELINKAKYVYSRAIHGMKFKP